MREKVIEKKLALEVKRRGGLCEKWNSGTSGWPDRIVLLPDGKFGLVEVKAPGEEPRPLQLHRHMVLVYKCGQEKLNNLYYQMKEQRR